MLSLKQTIFLPVLILLITFISVNQWNKFDIGGPVFIMGISLLTVISVFWCKIKYFRPDNIKDYRLVLVYLLWLLVGIIRGFVEMDEMGDAADKWRWQNFILTSFALVLPIFVYVFSIPEILQKTLKIWFTFALFVFAGLMFTLSTSAYHFYLGPVLLMACFLPILPKRWKIILAGLLFLMIFINFTARSQVIKAGIALMISFAYIMSKYLSKRFFGLVHWICYIVPIILLYLGIAGIFNVFRFGEELNLGEVKEEKLSTDTRSGLYYEVITSAVKHNYIWQGRTPARGNDTELFSKDYYNTERFDNEFCHPNVFTWLGMIGVILYSLIYLKSSYLAVYKSNNIWIKLLGLYIAFRWFFGWIEDINHLTIMSISLWMMIAMGFSEQFRQMNNEEFKEWAVGVFQKSNR